MNVKIFRANRGEGKTKWLVDRAIEAKKAGYELVYVGNKKAQDKFEHRWTAEMHELCPLKSVISIFTPNIDSRVKYCFLTDDLIDNFTCIHPWQDTFSNADNVWYITMDAANFVN